MLDRFVLIGNIIGAWIFGGILTKYLQKYYSRHPPAGIIYKDNSSEPQHLDQISPPGTRWSRIGVMYTMTFNMLVMIFLVGLLIFDRWRYVAPYIAIDLPIWVNILGSVLLWGYIAAGAFTLTYNVNYTPLYHQMPSKYYLIIGGPYRFVRHPMYVLKMIILAILIFLIFGAWLPILGIPGWITLPFQARDEEEILSHRFGADFDVYRQTTGRFIPKLRYLFHKKTR